jgi:hypothetical protein
LNGDNKALKFVVYAVAAGIILYVGLMVIGIIGVF